MPHDDELNGFNDAQKLSLYKYLDNYQFTGKNISGLEEGFKDMIDVKMNEQALNNGKRFGNIESKAEVIDIQVKENRKYIIYSIVTILGACSKIVYDLISK